MEVNIAFFFSFHVGDALDMLTSSMKLRYASILNMDGLPDKVSCLLIRTSLINPRDETY